MSETILQKIAVPLPAKEEAPTAAGPLIEIDRLSLHYGSARALNNISVKLGQKVVTAFIGPSGCGKSTLLRCLNRMNDLIDNVRIDGSVRIGANDIYSRNVDVIELRKRVGMVFQKSNPFPKSIYENIAFGLRLHGIKRKSEVDTVVEQSLRSAALWDEVKDRLHTSALGLSGGQLQQPALAGGDHDRQLSLRGPGRNGGFVDRVVRASEIDALASQQRLCIARAIAIRPEIILMDEPASALDPLATARIEELILELKKDFTIVIVTHNMQQAARISDDTAFFYLGELIEFDTTRKIFTSPAKKQTEDYVTGRFG